MGYVVKTTDFSRISLNETDKIKSALQNVAIILKSVVNTNVLYREFGISGQMLDKPENVAFPRMYAEIREKIEEYEPRVSVLNISFEIDTEKIGRVVPVVEIEFNE